MAICFVCKQSLGAMANSKVLQLSSKMVHLTFGLSEGIFTTHKASSLESCMMNITFCRAVDSAMYLALVVDNAMIGSFDNQQIGQLAKVMKNLVCNKHKV